MKARMLSPDDFLSAATHRHSKRPRVELVARKPAWDPAQLPDLTGRTYLVTGSNAGLGYFSSEQLVRAGARVYMTGRSPNRLMAARAAMRRRNPDAGDRVETLLLDTSNLGSVRAAISRFGLRPVMYTRAPAPTSCSLEKNPRPAFDPVIRYVRPDRSGSRSGSHACFRATSSTLSRLPPTFGAALRSHEEFAIRRGRRVGAGG